MRSSKHLLVLGIGLAAVVLIGTLALRSRGRQGQIVSRATVEQAAVAAASPIAQAGASAAAPLVNPTAQPPGQSLATSPEPQQPSAVQATTAPARPSASIVVEPPQPVFFDDFSRVGSGWSPLYLDTAGNVNGYSAGAYRLRAAVPGQPLYDIHPALAFRPNRYAVDVRADNTGAYGLLLGVQGEPTNFTSLSYIAVAFTADEQLVLARRDTNATTTVIQQASLDGKPTINQENRLEVEQQPDGVHVVIDGNEALFAPDTQIPDGAFGVYVSAAAQPVEVVFDNLIAIAADRRPSPACAGLRSLPASPASGATGDDISLLQTRLSHLGYAINANGSYDAETVEEVQRFQQQNGLSEAGTGPETWCRLLSSNAILAETGRTEDQQREQQFRPVAIDPAAGLDVPLFTSIRQNDKTWQVGLLLPGASQPFYVDTDGNALDPALSPDQRALAFISNRGGTDTDSVWMLDLGNGALRQVSPPGRVGEYPVWSPDSRTLLFTDEPGANRPNAARLYLYDRETNQTRMLIDQHGGWSDWSVNNDIIFSGWSGKSYDLFRINPDGSGLTNLTNTDDRHEDIAGWSTDGMQLLFVANSPNSLAERQIFVRNRDGSGERQLTTLAGPNSNPIWLSSRTVVFAHQPTTDVWQPWIVGSDGSNPHQLSQNEGRMWFMNRALAH